MPGCVLCIFGIRDYFTLKYDSGDRELMGFDYAMGEFEALCSEGIGSIVMFDRYKRRALVVFDFYR